MSEDIETSISPPHTIPIELFLRSTNKTSKLINNASEQTVIDGRHRWYEYKFVEPVFMTEMRIECDGYGRFDEFEIEIEHIDGTKHQQKIGVNESSVELRLGKLASEFRFRPDSKPFSRTSILNVKVTGLTLDEFHSYEWAVREYESNLADIVKREADLDGLEDSIATLKKDKTELDSDIGKAQAQHSELLKTISNQKQEIEDLTSRNQDIARKVKAREENLRDIEENTQKTRVKLDELVRELRLYPSEISEFVREGGRNIKNYLLISVPFVIILAAVTISLFVRAVDLTQIWRQEEGVEVWTIFLTRLPFVLVALALIEATAYIIGRLIYEIIRINRLRLELAKLSIVAKDVSLASARNTELDDQAVFENETKLKMELLREHLKGYSGNEFEYKGGAIISAVSGVANRLFGSKKE